jgi:hypothetical protein
MWRSNAMNALVGLNRQMAPNQTRNLDVEVLEPPKIAHSVVWLKILMRRYNAQSISTGAGPLQVS